MNTITISKKLHHFSAIFVAATLCLGIPIHTNAQEISAGEITKIPHPKPDTNRNPPIEERRRVALGVPTVTRTTDGRPAILQNLDAASRIPSMTANDVSTIQGCQGITMSKEEAMRNGSVCVPSIP